MTVGNDWDPHRYDNAFGFVTEHGHEVLDLLGEVAGGEVLDLGCGTGHLTVELLRRGAAQVVGIDLSAPMLATARSAYPGVRFVQGDAQVMTLPSLGRDGPFDAVFSNAALHWMPDGAAVARAVRGVLRPGGRFAAELGGEGNIAAVDGALRGALADFGLQEIEVPAQTFPSLGTQAAWLESAGFAIHSMRWFERPTPLPQGLTPSDWTRHFRARVWDRVPAGLAAQVAQAVDRGARTAGLHEGGWFIDYRRLRFLAQAR